MKHSVSSIFKLIGKVLLWILALAFIAVPAVIINKIYGYLLLLFVVILVGASVGIMFYLKKKIHIAEHGDNVYCRRGEDVSVDMQIVNDSRIFCPKLTANIYISDLFGEVNVERESRFMLAAKESVNYGFDSDMSHIGVYSIGINKITIYDFTGFFHTTIPAEGKFSACILPKIRHMEELHISEDINAESSSNTRVTVVGGTDYTGVREYALGDPMKQIHWKLSAHSREYMTKLQESNRQQEYSVVLDFASIKYEDSDYLMDVNDTLIETALSLIADISTHDAGYKLMYCNRKRLVDSVIPEGRANDMELITDFMPIKAVPDPSFPGAYTILQEEEKGQNRSTNVLVVTSRPTVDLIQELQRIKNQRRSPELYLVIPSGWNQRQREEMCAPLRQLEEYGVPYFIIETDINRTGLFEKDDEEEKEENN